MLRRSLLSLLAVAAALPILPVAAQDASASTADAPAPQDLMGAASAAGQPTDSPRALTPDEITLVNAISAHNTAITTEVGKFVQIDTRGNRSEGTFYLQRPGKIRFRYAPPSHEEIMSLGNGFYVIDREEKTQYAYPQDKVPLRQFLEAKIDLLNAGLVAIAQSANYVSLTLQDDTPAGTVRIALVFDKTSLDLVQWVLTDPTGVSLTFSLFDVQQGVAIPAAYFFLNIGEYNQVQGNN
jgi:outer membrane lipoprotein-sorting protein